MWDGCQDGETPLGAARVGHLPGLLVPSVTLLVRVGLPVAVSFELVPHGGLLLLLLGAMAVVEVVLLVVVL